MPRGLHRRHSLPAAALLAVAFPLAPAGASGCEWTAAGILPGSPDTGEARVIRMGSGCLVIADYGYDGEGRVLIHELTPAGWTLAQTLTPPPSEPAYEFGFALDLDGDTLAVGDRFAGRVHVYTRSGGAWSLQQTLMASDNAGGQYGEHVALDGDRLLIGARTLSGGAGAVYAYERTGDAWLEVDKLTADTPAASEGFGIAIALDGDRALIGANGAGSGRVYEFGWDGADWLQQDVITADDSANGDEFGIWIAIECDLAVISAWLDDNDAGADAGAAYVFRRTTDGWSQIQKLTADDAAPGDQLGRRAEIRDGLIYIGASEADTGAPNAGALYVFEPTASGWLQTTKIEPVSPGTDNRFAKGFDLDRGMLVVGQRSAPLEVLTRGAGASIVSQPAAASAPTGQPASFSVIASGAGPHSYEWLFNGQPIPAHSPFFTGQRTPILSVRSADRHSAGSYSVIVRDGCGAAVVSQSAALTAPACAGDLNGDGVTDFSDLNSVLSGFGCEP